MSQKTKTGFYLIITFWLFLLGVFLYFYKTDHRKKRELILAQDNQKTERREEEAVNLSDSNGSGFDEKAEKTEADGEKESDEVFSHQNGGAISDTKTTEEKEMKTAKEAKLTITNHLVSFGFQKASKRQIDTVIIHSSYDASGDDPYAVDGVIAEYKAYGVAPHYLIDRKGNIVRLVMEENIAYHAGESKMPDGRTGVNNFSIGIEMLTTKKDKLTQEQYDALKLLLAELKRKYKITSVLGHNQIAPGRKDDPWNFEWNKLK